MAPFKIKNKISIKQVKGLQKKFLHFFFFFFFFFVGGGGGGGGGVVYFCFLIVWSDIEV